MAGLIGYINKNSNRKDSFAIVTKMAHSIKHQKDQVVEVINVGDGKVSWGQVMPGFMATGSDQRQYDDTTVSILIWGDIYNQDSLSSSLQLQDYSNAALIAALYRQYGRDFIYKLDGDFIILLFDRPENKMFILNNPMGTYPLYFSVSNGNLVFASELKALLVTGEIKKDIDYCALADYFSLSTVLGNRTFLQDIQLLPPAAMMVFDLRSGGHDILRYWDIRNSFGAKKGNRDDIYEELRIAFNKAVSKRIKYDERLGIALSGGLDTRAILSAIDTDKYPLLSYTLGVPGCSDERVARQLSAIKKTQHTFAALNNEYLSRYLANAENMVFLTDGFYPPFEFTEMQAYNELRKDNFHILFRGHGGELAKSSLAWPYQVDNTVLNLRLGSNDLLKKKLLQEGSFVNKSMKWNNKFSRHYVTVGLKALFAEDFYSKMEKASFSSFDSMFQDVEGSLSPADICTYFYLHTESGRRTASALSIFRNQVDVRMPFLDSEFVSLLFGVHCSYRNTTDLHKYIISRNSPDLMKVPDSNTGAPLTAGPLLTSMIEKFSTLMKRLNIKGFVHYQSFHDWIRKEMPEIRGILLDKRTLNRGIYNADGLRTIIDQHMNQGYDHGYILGSLLGLELWFRMFLDGENSAD